MLQQLPRTPRQLRRRTEQNVLLQCGPGLLAFEHFDDRHGYQGVFCDPDNGDGGYHDHHLVWIFPYPVWCGCGVGC